MIESALTLIRRKKVRWKKAAWKKRRDGRGALPRHLRHRHRSRWLPVVLLAVGATVAAAEEASPETRLYGWYELESGERVLVQPSARGGLYVADFENDCSTRMIREGDGWTWSGSCHQGGARQVQFLEGHGKTSPPGFSWLDDEKNEHAAQRLDPPPYHVEEITIGHSGVDLSATLYRPSAAGLSPGAVFIHGSGPSDRDNLWYQAMAHRLVSAGAFVVLPDKRGTGKSGGDWTVASFEQFATDALAAADYLRRHGAVDPMRIGLVGMSQGGWIAPLAASVDRGDRRQDSDGERPPFEFVVAISAAAVTPNQQVVHELGGGALGKFRAALAKKKRPTWWQLNGDFDPLPHWKNLRARGLIVYGREDEHDNVPVERSVELLREVPPEVDLTVRVFDGAGHGISDPKTRRIDPEFLALLARFVVGG